MVRHGVAIPTFDPIRHDYQRHVFLCCNERAAPEDGVPTTTRWPCRPTPRPGSDRRKASHLTPRSTERSTIDGPAGALEIAQNVPATAPRGIALIAHPHPLQGGTLDNKVAQTLAKTFFALGYVAVRFNFRGVGQSEGTFDDGEGEAADALAALRFAQARFDAKESALPIVLAGFSFGAFVQTKVAQSVAAQRLVLVGPAVRRLTTTTVPGDTIVIHAEEDEVVPLPEVLAWARPQELPVIVFPGCGHFFHGRLLHLQRTIAGMWHGHAVAPGA
jgi:alpha/beta superfamily hydrolase